MADFSQLPSPPGGILATDELLVVRLQGGLSVPYQANVSQLPTGQFQQGLVAVVGPWNANTNSPTLVSSAGTSGETYIVSVSGNTNLNGNSTWLVGDLALFSDNAWNRILGPESSGSGGGGTSYTFVNGLSLSGTTVSPVYGTAANTIAEGNDIRIVGALQSTNNLSDLSNFATARSNLGLGALATENAPSSGLVLSNGSTLETATIGVGLSLSGTTLSANGVSFTVGEGLVDNSGTLSVIYGTASGTAAQGNDTRIVDALQSTNNLSDLTNAITARSNLGLGSLAVENNPGSGIVFSTGSALEPAVVGAGLILNNNTLSTSGVSFTVGEGLLDNSGTLSVIYGTTSGTAAQGNDSRIVGALQSANNLSDLTNAATARTNLGLGSLAIENNPGSGIVFSTGSSLEPAVIGSGITLNGNTLSANGISFVVGQGLVDNSGTLAVTTPTSSTLGGIFSQTAPANEFVTGVNASGDLTFAQPVSANISGLGSLAAANYPLSGIVFSTGSTFEPASIGSGLSLLGNALSANGILTNLSVSGSGVVSGVFSTAGGIADQSFQSSTPVSSGAITIPQNCSTYFVSGNTALTALAITMPNAPENDFLLTILFEPQVNFVSWAVGASDNGFYAPPPLAIVPGTALRYLYNAASKSWLSVYHGSEANFYSSNLYDYMFGAVGDGATDDSAAIQAGLNAVEAFGGGTFYLRPKTYYINNNITIPSSVRLKGYATPGANISGNGGLPSTEYVLLLNPIYTINVNSQSSIEGVLVVSSNALVTNPQSTLRELVQLTNYLNTSAAGKGISYLPNTSDILLRDVGVYGFQYGIYSPTGSVNAGARVNAFNVHIDCNTGILVNGCYDTSYYTICRVHPYLSTGSSINAVSWTINNITNDASGQYNITVGASNPSSVGFFFIDGDLVNLANAAGIPSSVNTRWTITNVNSGTSSFSLSGSTYSVGWTSGTGDIYVNGFMRFGAGFQTNNNTGVQFLNSWVLGHDIGYGVDGGSSWISFVEAGVDNWINTKDPTTIGFNLIGNSVWTRIVGSSISSQGRAIVCNTSGNGQNSIIGSMIATNGSVQPSGQISLLQGRLSYASNHSSGLSFYVADSFGFLGLANDNDLSSASLVFESSAGYGSVYGAPGSNLRGVNTGSNAFSIIPPSGASATLVLSTSATTGGAEWSLTATPVGDFSIFDNTASGTPLVFLNSGGFNTTVPIYFGGTYNPSFYNYYLGVGISQPFYALGGGRILNALLGASHVTATGSTSGTLTIPNDTSVYGIAASATVYNLTIDLPSAPKDSNLLWVYAENTSVSGLTLVPAAGQSVTYTPQLFNPGNGALYCYSSGTSVWHLIMSPAASGGSSYILPPATTSSLGGVVVSAGLSVTGGGDLSLAAPTASVLGGVFSSTAPANEFATGITTAGAVTYAQPTSANISGLGTMAAQNANAVDITGGSISAVGIGTSTIQTTTLGTSYTLVTGTSSGSFSIPNSVSVYGVQASATINNLTLDFPNNPYHTQLLWIYADNTTVSGLTLTPVAPAVGATSTPTGLFEGEGYLYFYNANDSLWHLVASPGAGGGGGSVTGLGSLAYQNANAVKITGGSIYDTVLGPTHQVVTAASSGTLTIPTGVTIYGVSASATVLNLTIDFPSGTAATDSQLLLVYSENTTVSGLTFTAAAGQTISNAPTGLSAGAGYLYYFSSGALSWRLAMSPGAGGTGGSFNTLTPLPYSWIIYNSGAIPVTEPRSGAIFMNIAQPSNSLPYYYFSPSMPYPIYINSATYNLNAGALTFAVFNGSSGIGSLSITPPSGTTFTTTQATSAQLVAQGSSLYLAVSGQNSSSDFNIQLNYYIAQ